MDTPVEEQVNHEIQIRALLEHNSGLLKDSHSLQSLVSTKNASIVRLEAENIRLKMTRTDKELSVQVDGLRAEISKKDKKLVELQKVIDTYKENEILTLRRASAAEQKIVLMQTTMGTMQKSRDASNLEAEKHDRARLDAVREIVTVGDQLRKANERVDALAKEIDELRKKQHPKKA